MPQIDRHKSKRPLNLERKRSCCSYKWCTSNYFTQYDRFLLKLRHLVLPFVLRMLLIKNLHHQSIVLYATWHKGECLRRGLKSAQAPCGSSAIRIHLSRLFTVECVFRNQFLHTKEFQVDSEAVMADYPCALGYPLPSICRAYICYIWPPLERGLTSHIWGDPNLPRCWQALAADRQVQDHNTIHGANRFPPQDLSCSQTPKPQSFMPWISAYVWQWQDHSYRSLSGDLMVRYRADLWLNSTCTESPVRAIMAQGIPAKCILEFQNLKCSSKISNNDVLCQVFCSA